MSGDTETLRRAQCCATIPREGSLDLTHRCNNACVHCWIREDNEPCVKIKELNMNEIKSIVDAANRMGCQRWNISGGEPMLRDDFISIYEYISRYSNYTLNTNGTLITSRIAALMKKRKGIKLISLYGESRETHDRITRTPGSFELMIQGIRYLREKGAGFTIQIIPMRSNFHKLGKMIDLAMSLGSRYRIGALWLNLSASGNKMVTSDIKSQRLSAGEASYLERLGLAQQNATPPKNQHSQDLEINDIRLFSRCGAKGWKFHIDPYGTMSFCGYIVNPALRYDLKGGDVERGWREFIPKLYDNYYGDHEYVKGCAVCRRREFCRWCPAFAYLEHGRMSGKIPYLCRLAAKSQANY